MTSEEICKKLQISPLGELFPPLEDGSKWAGAIISPDGTKNHRIALLAVEVEDVTWDEAMAWAKSLGGDLVLPDRCESALLFTTLKDEFKPVWYWTREQHADGSSYAWFQDFGGGDQYCRDKSYRGRARVVRRLELL